ncbi:unnamed protein product [Rotaria sp. Silwood2]|nr:unnamed protein product [Rotaria sp. Silwood2]CAF2983872.1 unnamed protein product [Rotaria sp. Silwood2]CAF3128450.1 unnamed protein product [Rotaria sp. Silwood2]CAF4369022.1 unnamed protein product [Rotaria sp. Silwood2]CAF4390147.1 unnamed protein product [Rotaria sp. Silwood2]
MYIFAHRLELLENADGNMVDPSKEHRSDLCARCQALGKSCTGKGNFIKVKPARSLADAWAHPDIAKDVFPTPKRTISSDSESD